MANIPNATGTKNLREIKSIKQRRSFLGRISGSTLEAVGTYPEKLEQAQFGNCENMIGATSIPLGIAGPLKILGRCAQGQFYLPLATTEGALVASVARGCKAINLSGGVRTYTEYVGITRGSIFSTRSLGESVRLKIWLDDNFQLLSQEGSKTSAHLTLKNIWAQILGKMLFVRFSFDTSDAMGMNMATFAAEKIAALIEMKTKTKCLSLAGNFDIDKKPAWLNFILGRGRKIWAEATVKKEVVDDILKTTPEKTHQLCVNKCLLGSALSGSLGFNAHFANIIAAIFIACGQDVAHTAEGGLGITSTEVIDEDLYISIFLPDLIVGTVGGGTHLPSQKEALGILGVLREKEKARTEIFAEIIAGAVLAGELSLLAALSAGELASSHRKITRESSRLPR